MIWTLSEVPEGALMAVEAAGVPQGISQADHEYGPASSLADLAAHVES